jgi:DNA-binding MarR family transcriptional regulator
MASTSAFIEFFSSQDWLLNPAIRFLEYHDRGIYLELLIWMYHKDLDEPKMLSRGGRAISNEAIARLLGLELPALLQVIKTFETAGLVARHPTTKALILK